MSYIGDFCNGETEATLETLWRFLSAVRANSGRWCIFVESLKVGIQPLQTWEYYFTNSMQSLYSQGILGEYHNEDMAKLGLFR